MTVYRTECQIFRHLANMIIHHCVRDSELLCARFYKSMGKAMYSTNKTMYKCVLGSMVMKKAAYMQGQD